MKFPLLKYTFTKTYRKLVNSVIRRLYQDTNRDTSKTILIVGSARSGTTWLSSIIASQDRRRVMFEPFNPHLVPEYSRFNYFQYMRPGDYEQGLYDFCRQIFTGNIRNAWIDREIQYLSPTGRVVKSIRSSLMLNWLELQFPEVPKLFIIRHPCAVVLSRMKLNWATDDDIRHFLSQPKLIEDFLKDKLEIIDKAKTVEQKHAVIWCVTNLVPLKQFRDQELNLVTYEQLVRNPGEEIPRIFDFLNLQFSAKIFTELKSPSSTATPTSAILTGQRLTNQWETDLPTSNIDSILSIVDDFGLSYLYSGADKQSDHGY